MANIPNLTDSSTNPIVLGNLSSSISKTGAILSLNASDFYKISLNSASNISLDFSETLADPFLNLYYATNSSLKNLADPYLGNIQVSVYNATDLTQKSIASTTLKGNSKSVTASLGAGDYIIKVENSNPLIYEDYSLKISLSTPTTTYQDEAGDTPATANKTKFPTDLIGQNISVIGKIAGYDTTKNTLIDSYDYYQFSISKKSKVEFSTTTSLINNNYYINDGKYISYMPNSATLPAGTYYLVVVGNSLSNRNSPSMVDYNISIKASEVPNLTYSAKKFNESSVNDGSIGDSVTATLSGDTFKGSVGATLPISSWSVPYGLSLTATKLSDTTAKIALVGKAYNHTSADSVNYLGFSFSSGTFTNNSFYDIDNYFQSGFSVNFIDPISTKSRILSFDKILLSETSSNNGSIDGFITVTLTGDTFTGTNNSSLPINVANLPLGLILTATKLTDNTAKITIAGNAINHNAINGVNNLKLTFPDSAFKMGSASTVLNNNTTQNFYLNFRDSASISYSSDIFTESTQNDGSISTKITATLSNDVFKGLAGSTLMTTVSNLPTGLSINAKKIDDSHAEITLLGNAVNHANINDINNLKISFPDSVFTNNLSNIINNSIKLFSIDFSDSIVTPPPVSNGSDPDGNSSETATNIQNLGLINSYGKNATGSIGYPATSTLKADTVDYFKFNLAYKGTVFADNSVSAVSISVKDDNGIYQPISSTNGIELSAGNRFFKVETTATSAKNYDFKLRSNTSPAGNEIATAPSGSKNLISPYTTAGFFGILDFGANQSQDPSKWLSSGTSTAFPAISSVAVVNLPKPIETVEQDGHVHTIITTRDALFPIDPKNPTVSSIPMYSDTNGNLILNYSFNYQNNVNADKISQNSTGTTLSPFNATQKIALRKAFDEWEKVAKIKFIDVTGTSKDTYNTVNMFVGNVSSGPGAAYVRAWKDSSNQLLKTDLWVNVSAIDSHMNDPMVGNYGYMAIMHEVGHALGLKHPGNYNAGGGGANGPFLTTALDTHQYSIMSYNDSTQTVDIASSGYSSSAGTTLPFESSSTFSRNITPAILDIPAFQYLYGENPTATKGNNTYLWATNQNVNASIFDNGGTDTIDASNQSQPQTINLNAGKFSNVGAFTVDGLTSFYFAPNNNFSINYQTVIENVTGGSGNDVLTGNSVDNVLDGKLGNDTLTGGTGNNTFIFSTTPNASTNFDTITDFKLGDRINLSLATFSALGGTAGNELASTRYSDSTTKTADTRIYADRSVSNQVSLYYDADGSATSSSGIKFATLTSFSGTLSASNFGIIA